MNFCLTAKLCGDFELKWKREFLLISRIPNSVVNLIYCERKMKDQKYSSFCMVIHELAEWSGKWIETIREKALRVS